MPLIGFGEMLPRADNRVTLHASRKDRWGIPLLHIDCTHGENDRKLAERANRDAAQMLIAAGFENVAPLAAIKPPGSSVHEMGTARMGRDPGDLGPQCDATRRTTCRTCSSPTVPAWLPRASVNPSLTYMALSARAANYAADRLASGEI